MESIRHMIRSPQTLTSPAFSPLPSSPSPQVTPGGAGGAAWGDEWQAAWGSVHVDAYGEEDPGLLRGARLALDPARWARLEALWRTQHLRAWCPQRWRRTAPVPAADMRGGGGGWWGQGGRPGGV